MFITIVKEKKNRYRLSSSYFLKHDLTYLDVKKELARFFSNDDFLFVRFKDLNKYLLNFCKSEKYNSIWQVRFFN